MTRRKTFPPKNSLPPENVDKKLMVGAAIGLLWFLFVFVRYAQIQGLPSLRPFPQIFSGSLVPSFSLILLYLKEFILYAGFLFGCAAVGYSFLKSWNGPAPLTKITIGTVLGMGVFSLVMLGLGLLQLYKSWVFPALWVGLVGFGILMIFKGLKEDLMISLSTVMEEIKSTNFFLTFFLGLALLVSFIMAFVPEIFYDSMVYHLGVPRWYLLEGGIKPFRNVHSYFPFNLQMLYVFGLGLSGEAIAKLIHWGCGLLLALLFISWGKEYDMKEAGIFAGGAFLLMPMTQMNWWTTGVDVGCSLFISAAVMSWAVGIRKEMGSLPWFIVSGVLAGVALGSKYTCGVLAPGLLAVHILLRWVQKKDLKLALKESFIMGGLIVAISLPWFVKNYFFIGNPVYPFLSQKLGRLPIEPEKMAIFYGQNTGFIPKNFIEILMTPWKVTFEQLSSLNYPGALPLALFPLIVWAAIRQKGSRPLLWILAVGAVSMSGVWISNRLLRYSMPFLAVFCFVFGAGFTFIRGKGWLNFFRIILIIGFSLISYGNFQGVWTILANSYRPGDVLVGRESRREYLSYTHSGMNPYPATKVYDVLKSVLPAGRRALILGDEKISTCEVPFLASGILDEPILHSWLKESKNGDELYGKFQENKIGLMVINIGEIQRLGWYLYRWSRKDWATLCELWEKYVTQNRVEYIDEKLFAQKIPVILSSVKGPEDSVPTQKQYNALLYGYEDTMFPQKEPDWIQKRLEFYEGLTREYPRISTFQTRLFELLAYQRNPK